MSLIKGVSLPCSRLRRKAASLNVIKEFAPGWRQLQTWGVSLPCSRLRRKPLAVALAGLLSLSVSDLLAQTSELTMYVFNEGVPVGGIAVMVDDELVRLSNENGLVELQLEPGIHYIELRMQDSVVHEQQILAVQDEYAQWIIDVTGGGSAIYDVESSSPLVAGAGAGAAVADTSDATPGLIQGRLVSAEDSWKCL